MKNSKLRSAIKLIRNNLLRLILFALGAILITWNNPLYVSAGNAQTSSIASTPPESISSDNALPVEIKTAVINDAVKRTSKPVSAIKITEARSQQWSDGCLGLATDEICTQAITPGYRVTVTDGINNWTYRTDSTGNAVRLEADGNDE